MKEFLYIVLMLLGIIILIPYVLLKYLCYEIWIDLFLAMKYNFIGLRAAIQTSLYENRQITFEELEELTREEEKKEPDFLKNHYKNKGFNDDNDNWDFGND